MKKPAVIFSSLLLWCLIAGFYGQLGISVLKTEIQTGEKYCVNPLAETLGITDSRMHNLLLFSALFALFFIPVALACYLFFSWRNARRKK